MSFGYFAITVIGPCLTTMFGKIGMRVDNGNALLSSCVIAFIVMPQMVLLIRDAMLREYSRSYMPAIALGSTHYEAMIKIVVPGSFQGIRSAMLFCISRVLGETTVVSMTAGATKGFAINPLKSISTLTIEMNKYFKSFDQSVNSSGYTIALMIFLLIFMINFAIRSQAHDK